eukprot:g1654.t1
MGRNKSLNKLRKKNAPDRNGASGNGKSRVSTTAIAGRAESAAGEYGHGGPLRKLLGLVAAYPFVVIALAMGLTRVFPACMRWVRMRSGLFGPVVPVRRQKQVLIVGALGSGTLEMSAALTKLGVEVGHETSDSSNEPCRDGTISWVHAIRFLSGTPNLSLLCGGPRRQAYASTMFQPSAECSYLFRSWSPCWANHCRAVAAREYGCALRQRENDREKEAMEAEGQKGREDDAEGSDAGTAGGHGSAARDLDQWDLDTIAAGDWGSDGGGVIPRADGGEEEQQECGTPFRHNLLQVRHPLRSVSLLVYKSAANKETVGRDCSAGRQQIITVSSIFPNKFVRTHERLGGRSPGPNALSDFDWARAAGSCVQTWAWYWVVYNRAMMDEVDRWYRVEDTPPVKVALMSGFSGLAVDEAFQASEQESGSGHGPLEGSNSSVGGWEVTWEDIAAYPGGLLQEMSDLAVELGYEGAPWLHPVQPGAPDDNGQEGSSKAEARKGWRGIFRRRKQAAKSS